MKWNWVLCKENRFCIIIRTITRPTSNVYRVYRFVTFHWIVPTYTGTRSFYDTRKASMTLQKIFKKDNKKKTCAAVHLHLLIDGQMFEKSPQRSDPGRQSKMSIGCDMTMNGKGKWNDELEDAFILPRTSRETSRERKRGTDRLIIIINDG